MTVDTEIDIFSVSELNSSVRSLLEDNFPSIWVEGEVSNLAQPSSGHMYLSLKDSKAQVRCAFFRGRNRLLNFALEDGMQVLVRANVSLYEGRGDFQLIIQHMELAGDGALQREFELLKAKLAKEGLFDAELKRELPTVPKTIGIITSAMGAAIRDILSVLKRRYPIAPVIIYPCPVQGEAAAKQIIAALQKANKRKECDVLILARGGGSLEDLWCFNDEALAREIFNSELPIVSGVGHEVDFTIADFVADVRAATPTAAAELVSPNQQVWLDECANISKRLFSLIKQKLNEITLELKALSKQIRHPGQIIREQSQTVDYAEQRLIKAIKQRLKDLFAELKETQQQLKHASPLGYIENYSEALAENYRRIQRALKLTLEKKQQRLQVLARSLNTVSPLATLERGYAIARTEDKKTILRSTKDVNAGDSINILLSDGDICCSVKDKL